MQLVPLQVSCPTGSGSQFARLFARWIGGVGCPAPLPAAVAPRTALLPRRPVPPLPTNAQHAWLRACLPSSSRWGCAAASSLASGTRSQLPARRAHPPAHIQRRSAPACQHAPHTAPPGSTCCMQRLCSHRSGACSIAAGPQHPPAHLELLPAGGPNMGAEHANSHDLLCWHLSAGPTG